MVTVYSMTDCPWCEKVKKYLKSKGIEYKDINVEDDLEGRKALMALDKRAGVPMTVVDNNYVLGFERDQLDALLGLQ